MLDARIPAALGASLILHGAALALVDRLPRGGPASAPAWGAWDAGALQARLAPLAEVAAPQARAAAPVADARRDKEAQRAAPSSRGIASAPRYLAAEELDERPLIRTPVQPVFPDLAPAKSGRVVLRLHINEAGLVDEVKALRADPPGAFEAAAVEAFRPARFTPGRKDGAAVKSALDVELLFGEAPPPQAHARLQDQPMWQPPRRARSLRNPSTQEKP